MENLPRRRDLLSQVHYPPRTAENGFLSPSPQLLSAVYNCLPLLRWFHLEVTIAQFLLNLHLLGQFFNGALLFKYDLEIYPKL